MLSCYRMFLTGLLPIKNLLALSAYAPLPPGLSNLVAVSAVFGAPPSSKSLSRHASKRRPESSSGSLLACPVKMGALGATELITADLPPF